MSAHREAQLAAHLISKTWLLHLLTRIHKFLFRLTAGRLGGQVAGLPVLILTTRGRRSRLKRSVPLCYLPVPLNNGRSGYAVVASYGGSTRPPAWYLNLQAMSLGEVEVWSSRYSVRSWEADEALRNSLWEDFCECYPGYEAYQARTARKIAILILEPYA